MSSFLRISSLGWVGGLAGCHGDHHPGAHRARGCAEPPVDGGDLPEQVREWPTDDDPAAFGEEETFFADGTRCGVVDGALGALWLAELNASTQMTRWTTDGENRFSVMPRPVLPHEDPACPEFAAAAA